MNTLKWHKRRVFAYDYYQNDEIEIVDQKGNHICSLFSADTKLASQIVKEHNAMLRLSKLCNEQTYKYGENK